MKVTTPVKLGIPARYTNQHPRPANSEDSSPFIFYTMKKKISYSSAKGIFVQQKMAGGLTNKQAHRAWKKSTEKKAFPTKPHKGIF